MRIMVDSNVLISASIFESKLMAQVMKIIALEARLVLSSSIIDETRDVVKRTICML